MKTALHTIALTFALLTAFAQEAQSNRWDYHGKLLKQQFDTAHWREFYSDDTWRMRCIFVDMDADGEDELVAATTSDEEDRLGWVWNIYKNGTGHGFKRMYHRYKTDDKWRNQMEIL